MELSTVYKTITTGIDIDRFCLRAAVVHSYKGRDVLVSCEELHTTTPLFSNNYQLNYQEFVKKLQQLKRKLPILAQKVSMAIPENAVFCKELEIESNLSSVEEEAMIYHHFSSVSPLPLKELCIDYVKEEPVNEELINKVPINKELDITARYYVYATHKAEIEVRRKSCMAVRLHPVFIGGEKQIKWALVKRLAQSYNCFPVMIDVRRDSIFLIAAYKTHFIYRCFVGGKQNDDENVRLIAQQIESLFSTFSSTEPYTSHSSPLPNTVLVMGESDSSLSLALIESSEVTFIPAALNKMVQVAANLSLPDVNRFLQATAIAIHAVDWQRENSASRY